MIDVDLIPIQFERLYATVIQETSFGFAVYSNLHCAFHGIKSLSPSWVVKAFRWPCLSRLDKMLEYHRDLQADSQPSFWASSLCVFFCMLNVKLRKTRRSCPCRIRQSYEISFCVHNSVCWTTALANMSMVGTMSGISLRNDIAPIVLLLSCKWIVQIRTLVSFEYHKTAIGSTQ